MDLCLAAPIYYLVTYFFGIIDLYEPSSVKFYQGKSFRWMKCITGYPGDNNNKRELWVTDNDF